MPLRRLRRILENEYILTIDSSPATVRSVAESLRARQAKMRGKGKQPPPAKPPSPVAMAASNPSLTIRAIDLLRKIGDLTTPSAVNMASLSASWATRRYFWAIAEGRTRFRLADEVMDLDFHQKTLLSDE